jgi:hypothetical protein
MEPVLNILQWSYPASIDAYRSWLKSLLSSSSVAGAVAVFEPGNEPNLNAYTESGGTWNGTQYTSPWSGFGLEWCRPDGSTHTCEGNQPLRINPAFAQFAALAD